MPRILVGLYGAQNYGGFNPFLNWWKIANAPSVFRAALGTTLADAALWAAGNYLDANGDLIPASSGGAIATSDTFTRIFFTPPGADQIAAGANFTGETWSVEWDGTATCTFGGGTSGSSQSASGSNKRNFTMGTSPTNTWVTFTITNPNDPPRNVRIYQQRYASEAALAQNFNPNWELVAAKFDILRFMDFTITNRSRVVNYADIATEAYHSWISNDPTFGPKYGGMPLSLIASLCNRNGRRPHICIPHQATDACVQSIAQFFKDNLNPGIKPLYEYSNECWNNQFTQYTYCTDQGNLIWPGDNARVYKFYGYRSAQVMKIIRDVYNDRTRWEGCWATQTAFTGIMDHHETGFNKWRSDTGSSLTNADLFDAIYVTGYFGDVWPAQANITAITKANPGVVTRAGHGYVNGDRLKIFAGSGMTQLNNTYVTVANATTNTYELQGIDTTGFGDHVQSDRTFTTRARLFELLDESAARNGSDPVTYPTIHSYFNAQMSASFLTGTCDFGITTSISLNALKATYWPANKSKATTNGLKLRQYEGGNHFLGSSYLTGFGGVPQFNAAISAVGHCSEMEFLYAAMYQGFIKAGGEYPSKFVMDGSIGRFGSWAGIRYWPLVANGNTDDKQNPVWKATTRANEGKRLMRIV